MTASFASSWPALHDWSLSPAEARALQTQLAARVSLEDTGGPLRRVAGVDVAFPGRGRRTRAAVVVLDWPSLSLREQAVSEQATRFPYVPGLLSFRELPAVLSALASLEVLPDLVFCDGQGIAHPRRFGVACHLGVITGLATIGVAKRRLHGEHAPVPETRGSRVPLMDGEACIGHVLRSRDRVRPLFISPGHRISPETALARSLACLGRFRLLQPLRLADRLAAGQRL